MSRVLVPIADGFEEIETSSIVDILRRGGVEVVLAGLTGPDPVRGSRGITFVPDAAFDPADHDFDLVVLPGGADNADALAHHDRLTDLLRKRVAAEQPVAAICAAPKALDSSGVLPEGQFTCYPGLESSLKVGGRRDEAVVDHAGVITSQGPGTAMAFALHLLERLEGAEVRGSVADGLLYDG